MPTFNLKELFDELKTSYLIVSENGHLIYKNKKGNEILTILHGDLNGNIITLFEEKLSHFSLEDVLNKTEIFYYNDKPGSMYYFEFTTLVKKVEDQVFYIFCIQDITEYRKHILDNEIYKTIFNSAASAIVVTDKDGTIEDVNPAFEKLTGYSYEEALGNNPSLLNSGYHSKKFFEEMWGTLSMGKIWRGNLHDKIKNGNLIWEKSVISPILDKNGEIVKYIAIKENITKEKMQEEALKSYSYQDYLTGLYNRRKFIDYTTSLIDYAIKSDIHLYCLMIDIDNFKKVNDTYGHEVGDLVLIKLAECMKANVRANDIASRYGGEEFVIILSRYSYEMAFQRAEKIREDIERSTVVSNQYRISVTASIGFCKYDNKSSISNWLKMADEALYKAKRSGKNRVCDYSELL